MSACACFVSSHHIRLHVSAAICMFLILRCINAAMILGASVYPLTKGVYSSIGTTCSEGVLMDQSLWAGNVIFSCLLRSDASECVLPFLGAAAHLYVEAS